MSTEYTSLSNAPQNVIEEVMKGVGIKWMKPINQNDVGMTA